MNFHSIFPPKIYSVALIKMLVTLNWVKYEYLYNLMDIDKCVFIYNSRIFLQITNNFINFEIAF